MSLLGNAAPDFTLVDTKKQPHQLSAQRGKKVVLVFYPGAFTGVCTKEMCTFRDSMAQLNEVGATVWGISVDSPFANGGFAERNGLDYPLLSDFGRTTLEPYGIVLNDFAGLPGYVAAQRSVFVVDEDGRVIYEWIAPNPGVEPDYDAVKAAVR